MAQKFTLPSGILLLALAPFFLLAQQEEFFRDAPPPPFDTLHFPVWPGCYSPTLSELEQFRCTAECMAALVYSKLDWPTEPLDTSGFVKIRVHVNEDGTLGEFALSAGLHPLLDQAVLRAFNTIVPKADWRPALKNGQEKSCEFDAWIKCNSKEAEKYVLALRSLEKSEFQRQREREFLCPVVEIMPSFPGGHNAMLKFIAENLEIDATGWNSCYGTMAVVSFVVERDGKISDPKIVKSAGPGIDAACLKLFEKMPNWIPARRRGQAQRTQMNWPIRVRLE